jgi:hypothetical protein
MIITLEALKPGVIPLYADGDRLYDNPADPRA